MDMRLLFTICYRLDGERRDLADEMSRWRDEVGELEQELKEKKEECSRLLVEVDFFHPDAIIDRVRVSFLHHDRLNCEAQRGGGIIFLFSPKRECEVPSTRTPATTELSATVPPRAKVVMRSQEDEVPAVSRKMRMSFGHFSNFRDECTGQAMESDHDRLRGRDIS
ncbi:hypothetical protein GQ600_7567 [Phytophthora cactorum]|nr:hypothetical protein GQ600_7567 [Phytophthora cactorum]